MDTLYRQIANELASDIQQGMYVSGQKIPSVRKLSTLKACSISTVNQAYALLEDQGFIRAKPQSGYFVKEGANDPIKPPPLSLGGIPQTIQKSDLISTMLNAVNQPSLLNFGAAIAHNSFMPQRALQNHIQKVSRFQSDQLFNYVFSPGLPALRRQIATRMREVNVRCHQDDIVITQGCSEALALCLKNSTQEGDIIAVESPCYYGFLQLAKLRKLKVIEIPTDSQNGISLEALALALKQWPIKLIAVASRYSNPTGAVLSKQKQMQLYKLAQQYDTLILEDDIYGELGFKNPVNSVLKTFDTDDRVMYCSSFSKALSPGMRVGWCIPGKRRKQIIEEQTFTSFSPSTLSQYAISSYLETGHYDKHLRKFRIQCEHNIEAVTLAVRQHFPSGTCISQPRGGFCIWISLPSKSSTVKIQQQALEQSINIAPGALFSNSDEFDSFLRLNCALPFDDKVRNAIKVLGQLAFNN